MEQITTELIRECFGEDVEIENLLFGGRRITKADGSEVEITRDSTIKPWCGGEEIYRGMVMLGGRAWGHLVVSGPDELVLACMAWGERLGITVIPVVKDSGDGCMRFILATIVLVIVCVAAEQFIGNWLASMAFSLIAAKLADDAFEKALKRQERRRGQKYRSGFPSR